MFGRLAFDVYLCSAVHEEHMRIRLYFILIIAAVIMASCRPQSPETTALFAQADSLLSVRPDSAYTLLSRFPETERASWRKADRMRYEVLLADAMNKAYIPFTTDSVLKQVVRYYDRLGSNNEQLRARYLLGCAYRDMGEAPAAINAWEEAVDCADTLSRECDYNTLYRVYGQMANVFLAQQLSTQEIEAYRKYSLYALKAGNTYAYIRGKEFMIQPYYQQQDTAAVFRITEETRNLYLEQGMTEAAARVYPIAISVLVQYGMYERADSLMRIFESQSGLFDSSHNIAREYLPYYQSKGLYYLGVEKPDSAEFYFRELIATGHLMKGYRGLKALYQYLQMTDSISLYSDLYDNALHKAFSQIDAQATQQTADLFNYKRNERLATSKTNESHRLRNTLILTTIGLLTLSFVLYWFLFRLRRESKTVLRHKETIQKQEHIISQQEEEFDCLMAQKQELFEQLELANNALANQSETEQQEMQETIRRLMNTDILKICKEKIGQRFVKKGGIKVIVDSLDEQEWKMMKLEIEERLPQFYKNIAIDHHLSKQEFRAAILFRLGFDYYEIGILLGTDTTRTSKLKDILSKKLNLPKNKSQFLMAIRQL